MSETIRLECIKGSLMGQSFDLEEGKTYLMGRAKDSEIFVSEGSVSRQNTLFRVEDGIAYIGNRKQHLQVGTWLNGKHMEAVADPENLESGWLELEDGDQIGLGTEGKVVLFVAHCPKKELSIASLRQKVERELANPSHRRPMDIMKGAKAMPDNTQHFVNRFMQGVDIVDHVQKICTADESPLLQVSIPKGHIRFESQEDNMPETLVTSMMSKEKTLAVTIPKGHIKMSEYTMDKEPVKKAPLQEDKPQKAVLFQEKKPGEKSYEHPEEWGECIKNLGKGGFATVYLLKDTRDGENLVLKKLDVLQELTQSQVAKYRREAEIGLKLEHPNLVKTYSFNENQGKYSIVLEYCNNGSLRDLLDQYNGYLDLEDAVELFLQVLDGLDYLHHVRITQPDEDGNLQEVEGVVHRDIKPDNLLLHKENGKLVVKISDFGLAKAYELAGYSGMTGGEVAGSFKYVSKKQLSANYRYAKPSEDIFSATATFYEMLSGEVCRDFYAYNAPYEAILKGNLIPLKKANSSIPSALADVVDRVLQEEQLGSDEEYTSAAELKQQIIDAMEWQV